MLENVSFYFGVDSNQTQLREWWICGAEVGEGGVCMWKEQEERKNDRDNNKKIVECTLSDVFIPPSLSSPPSSPSPSPSPIPVFVMDVPQLLVLEGLEQELLSNPV